MNEIIITNQPEIRLNDSFFEFNIEEANISIDMRALFSSDTYSEDAWISITPILKSDWSPISKIADWLRNDNLKQYINIVNNEIGYYPIKTVRGRYNSGTWIHYYLLDEFLRVSLPTDIYFKLKLKGVLDISNIQPKNIKSKHVYIILAHDNTIKIGITSNFDRRVNQIRTSSGKDIVDFIFTDKLSNAYNIEQFLLAYFDDYRINGEWLQGVTYDVVDKKLNDVISKYYLNDMALEDNKIKLIEIK